MPEYTKPPETCLPDKFASLQAANSTLDTLEIEGCKQNYLAAARKECREVSKVLLAKHLAEPLEDDLLFKAHCNIKRCSLQGAFRNLSESVNYKIGQALCKNRLCPNCQRVGSAKRKSKFLAWYALNRETLGKYGFYHLVLTMRHKAADNLRTDVYTEELLQSFKKLRGGLGYRDNKEYWDKRVAGGLYSVETTVAHDETLHIHLHCVILGKMPLWRKVRRVDAVQTVRNGVKRVYKKKKQKADSDKSEFEKQLSARWLAITGDSVSGVFIEPVYKLDKEKNKVYCQKGQEDIEAAVSECIKYTMKADAESVNKFSAEHLRGLLQLKKRYSGRFGCLTAKSKDSAQFVHLDMLNVKTHELELAAISREELRHLFNPETGEIVEKEATRIVVTWFSNMEPKESEVETHNRFTLPTTESVVLDVLGTSVVTMRTTQVKELIQYERGETPYGGDTYYSIRDGKQAVYFENHERKEVAMRLAGSMYCRYDEINDLPETPTS